MGGVINQNPGFECVPPRLSNWKSAEGASYVTVYAFLNVMLPRMCGIHHQGVQEDQQLRQQSGPMFLCSVHKGSFRVGMKASSSCELAPVGTTDIGLRRPWVKAFPRTGKSVNKSSVVELPFARLIHSNGARCRNCRPSWNEQYPESKKCQLRPW